MSFAKKVVVAVGLRNSVASSDGMASLGEMSFLQESEVHFVHVFKTINYAAVFGEFTAVYPMESQRLEIENSVLTSLVGLTKDVLPPNFKGRVIHRCLFTETPKLEFCDYAEKIKADLIIVPTRRKRGIFESSFAQYVNKHTRMNMILLKVE